VPDILLFADFLIEYHYYLVIISYWLLISWLNIILMW